MPKGKQRKKDSITGKKPVFTFTSNSITEGDSLTTTLTNLQPRKKFFYALTGDGIDESDLDSGKTKGRLKASKQGTAVIGHRFSEDNFNEGTETFTLRIFKDKKNRKLLGESQTVSITESKNTKKTKSHGSKLFTTVSGIEVYSDNTYDKDSDFPGKSLLGENISEIEYELGENAIIITHGMYDYDGGGGLNTRKNSIGRLAIRGDFKYSKKGNFLGGEIDEIANWSYTRKTSGEYIGETISVDQSSGKGRSIIGNLFLLNSIMHSMQDRKFNYLMDGKYHEGDPKKDFSKYITSQYFEDNWWENPFATDLI